ncbi:hypothetical protein G6O69_15390 [Pseudenhygromyxa sp. WMMC2535]|uniref:hypothetical protein n=1 Tax=Pseudenhygromyxa sp. WMMC2535 TaxID=2712867 RepID=UPI0015956C4E|nr:hypothetical protein [Pseudenhygromyxa sp. WMMC2535]NVB39226.1 hypothetical protein [Pseudenhygromyxa sp. WMMC2535]
MELPRRRSSRYQCTIWNECQDEDPAHGVVPSVHSPSPQRCGSQAKREHTSEE